MEWKILKDTFKRNLIINLRAYPKDFFIGNLLTGVYTVISALFMYKMLFDGNITEEFVQYTSTGDYMGYIILGSLTYLFAVRTCLNVSRSLIIELRERLHSLQGEAERNGRFDYEQPKVKELLDKHIAEYNRRSM